MTWRIDVNQCRWYVGPFLASSHNDIHRNGSTHKTLTVKIYAIVNVPVVLEFECLCSVFERSYLSVDSKLLECSSVSIRVLVPNYSECSSVSIRVLVPKYSNNNTNTHVQRRMHGCKPI